MTLLWKILTNVRNVKLFFRHKTVYLIVRHKQAVGCMTHAPHTQHRTCVFTCLFIVLDGAYKMQSQIQMEMEIYIKNH